MTNKYYETICAIAVFCLLAEIPFEVRPIFDGWQIIFRWADGADFALHSGTYGNKSLLVEGYKFPWDDGDVTMMTQSEACVRIYDLYEEYKSEL